MSERAYIRLVLAFYVVLMGLCAYGAYQAEGRTACLQRPWLDTRGGC
ncbi:hypothetical protein JQ617_08110 [Bradyrhizobium sp. KB893862 SZCCT0404]|nr:hypothetical protein [Bradyrhizobium sp. KB893862 SZCCT0404]MBR1173914.1 hypothetical protein [Bradyrhizobium sp. KB893862 SZCCT0404]